MRLSAKEEGTAVMRDEWETRNGEGGRGNGAEAGMSDT
jgi:hypothetical protein